MVNTGTLGETLLGSRCDTLAQPADAAKFSPATPATTASTTLGHLRASKTAVYDFWTTRCTNCPAALDSLDTMAEQRPSVRFISVNIDDADAAKALLEKAASEGRWTRLTHAHLEEDVKENAKTLLGMKTVPFYVVVDQNGTVLRHGNAKALPLKSLNQLDDVLLQEDGEKENDSGVANVKPASPPPTVPSPVAPTSGGQDCEGGVCKLVRKKPATDPAPAPASGGQECEGGVCTLVRKKPTVASVPAASAVTAGSPGPTGNVMQCEGGVCKLVRKKTTPTVDGAAAASGGETRQGEVVAGDGTTAGNRDGDAAAAAVGESLGDGDVMPSLEVVCMDGGERKSLDDVTGGGPAVLDFWTTRCVRCPAALDALEALAFASKQHADASVCGPPGDAATHSRYTYVSVNLDNLDAATKMVSEGRWPSLIHVFAGSEEDTSNLERFKTRTGMKSVPFYVVVGKDGRIEQIGGPKAVNLGKTASEIESATPSGSVAAVPTIAPKSVSPPAAKATAFTIDEDF